MTEKMSLYSNNY